MILKTLSKKFQYKLPSPPLLAAILAFLVMSIALLFSPVTGMADNGDFYRIINGQGLYKLDRYEDDQFFDYASTKFGVYEYFNEYQPSSFSSYIPFVAAAKWLDSVFTSDNKIFDIRFLGILMMFYFTIVIYLLVDYVTYGKEQLYGYIIALLAVFILADIGYIAYFNSFYTEGLVFISFLFALVSMLLITQKRYSPYLLLGLFFLNVIILAGTKQQNATLGLLFGAVISVVPFLINRTTFGSNATSVEQTTYSKGFRSIAIGCGVVLCFAGIAFYVITPKESSNIDSYHTLSRGVLMTATDPESALEGFQINPQYALLNRSTYYERYPVVEVESPMIKEDLYSRYGAIEVVGYYLINPSRFFQMLDIATNSAQSVRPVSIGNFDRSAEKEPRQQAILFSGYDFIKRNFMPRTLGFIVIWIVITTAFYYKDRAQTLIIISAILMGLFQVVVSIINSGDANFAKHTFLFDAAFTFSVFIVCSSVFLWLYGQFPIFKKISSRMPKPKEETVSSFPI